MRSLKKRAKMAGRVAGLVWLLGACGDDDDPKMQPVDASTGTPTADGSLADGASPSPTPDAAAPGRDSGPDIDGAQPPGQDASPGPVGPDARAADAALDAASGATCANACNDGVSCTVDSCVEGRCVHKLNDSACQAGASCDLKQGCIAGKACTSASECADNDPCTSNERCDATSMRCTFDTLDRDGDGDAPTTCGGTDCDDFNGLIGPTASDACDGVDNDCDGMRDEQATCAAGRSCQGGACTCASGRQECPLAGCVDQQTDPNHCGGCGQSCGLGGVCTQGACSCPATGSVKTCNDACTDTARDPANCGECGTACTLIGQGGQLSSCLGGDCVQCGREGQPCCAITGCSGALTCQGEQGSPSAMCVCGQGSLKCGNSCVDVRADEANCGACGVSCDTGEVCHATATGAACAACGGIGEPCCDGLIRCPGAGVCGPDGTCVRPSVPPVDAGSSDAGPRDAGPSDAGTSDAALTDAAADATPAG